MNKSNDYNSNIVAASQFQRQITELLGSFSWRLASVKSRSVSHIQKYFKNIKKENSLHLLDPRDCFFIRHNIPKPITR